MSVAAVLLLTACQSPTATSAAGASSGDVEFVTNAYQLIMFDRQEGELARNDAMDPQVRALSAKMVDDANRFAAELAPIAAAEGIQQPNILDYGRRVRLSHMRLQHGLDFDEAYINDQIASHQEALSMHEVMTSSQGNLQLKALSEHARALVRENLAQLQAIQRKMMMRR
jgi:putative membrane protein